MARRPASFGQRKTISEGLAATRPVRYDLAKGNHRKFTGIDQSGTARDAAAQGPAPGPGKPRRSKKVDRAVTVTDSKVSDHVIAIKDEVIGKVLKQIDFSSAVKLSYDELVSELQPIIAECLSEVDVVLNRREQLSLEGLVINEMLGFGPLEPLLRQDDITDILVNGANQVYVERRGKLERVDVKFRDDAQVLNVASRMVTQVGRRIDQTTPLVDARLKDGSRVNVIIPPLAIRGPSISIRKFSKKPIELGQMVRQNNLSKQMATVLKVATASRMNILVSGGTGSGKTTLLNAMSRLIDLGERIVTIEDAAELQLQQPHIVSLETRPPNLDGRGAITIRDLVRNALRMRPDRIIVGEIRGSEAIDMLQAMNTGHDGSMSTLHSNGPRDTLTRLENMFNMGSMNMPLAAIRRQIADAVNMIVHISRMRDGLRRVTHIVEVAGMEGDVITTQDIYAYHYSGEDSDGNLRGDFVQRNAPGHLMEAARSYNLDGMLRKGLKT